MTESKSCESLEAKFVGMAERDAEQILGGADLLLNFHQRIHPELLARARRTALVDIDPGLLQYWISSGLLDVPEHDIYLTIGETVGTPAAKFPDCGLNWVHIRPPVFLDEWPLRPPADPTAAFTTVSSWHGDEYILEGDGYWDNNKRVEWMRFVDLPKMTKQPLEIATFFGKKDATDRLVLERHRWRVRHTVDVAGTPEDYRSYVQSSRGEFSCAKPSCMRFQNAWVSDRTLCYLASGRPAVVQDTGPSAYLPSGEGLHRFSNPEQAAAAIAAVNADYERNSRVAREIAEAYFDATEVARFIVGTALGDTVQATPVVRQASPT
jgi:hypothetical protein